MFSTNPLFMKYSIALFCLLVFQSLTAQPVIHEAVETQNSTLKERYLVLKSKSQTYEDYKVIKEYMLDGVWKITLDSIRDYKALLHTANTTILTLEAKVHELQVALKQKESSMEEIVHASTHISIMGVTIDKGVFKALVIMIILGLLLLLGMMTGKLKMMYMAIREKMELINITSFEFEEYRRKALDRQAKLSRELQTERNNLMELRRG